MIHRLPASAFRHDHVQCAREPLALTLLALRPRPRQVHMHYDGWQDIVNVDYAPVCIEQLAALHTHLPGLSYAVADCRRCAPPLQPAAASLPPRLPAHQTTAAHLSSARRVAPHPSRVGT